MENFTWVTIKKLKEEKKEDPVWAKIEMETSLPLPFILLLVISFLIVKCLMFNNKLSIS